jgi:serine/threonine protein kinase
MQITCKRYYIFYSFQPFQIKALKTLIHESVVQYVDSFDFDDGYGERQKAVVMEYCDSGDMSKLCSRRRRTKRLSEKVKCVYLLTFQLLIDYCLQILKGLDYLHNCSFVHRDIKP